jgi:hypothetical protein
MKFSMFFVFFYRNNPNLLLHELKGFEAPDFMLKKIRDYASHMRTDGLPESKKSRQQGDLCEGTEAGFTMVNMIETSSLIQSLSCIKISRSNGKYKITIVECNM